MCLVPVGVSCGYRDPCWLQLLQTTGYTNVIYYMLVAFNWRSQTYFCNQHDVTNVVLTPVTYPLLKWWTKSMSGTAVLLDKKCDVTGLI